MGRITTEDDTESHQESSLIELNAFSQFSHTNLTQEEIVALMGRRTLGFYKTEDEGEERWNMNPYIFNNEYFQELLTEDSKYIKLDDDKSLIEDIEARAHVEKFAEDEEYFFSVFSRAFSKLSEIGQEENLLSEI